MTTRPCNYRVRTVCVLMWVYLAIWVAACSSSSNRPSSRPTRPLFHNRYNEERGCWAPAMPAIDHDNNVVYCDKEYNLLLVVARAGRFRPAYAHKSIDASSAAATIWFRPYQQGEFSVTVDRENDTIIVAWANGDLDRHPLATGEAAIIRDGAPYDSVFAFIIDSPKTSASLKDFAGRIASRLSSDGTVQ